MITINTESLISIRKKAEINKQTYFKTHKDDNNKNNVNAKDTTFLYIGSYNADRGLRPLSPGTIFWNSPDIEIYKNGINVASNQITQGEQYQVIVTVRNDGDMNCPSFNLELFVTNPSLGFNLANATLLDVKRSSINRHSFKQVTFDLIANGNFVGHRCLFARVTSTSCNEFPLNANNFDAVNDRHVAQQNLTVIQQGQVISMQVNHTGELGKDVLMQLQPLLKLAPEFKSKMQKIMPKLKATESIKNFSFNPLAIKKLIGLENLISKEKLNPLLNLNQLNVNAIKTGIKLPTSLQTHNLRIDEKKMNLNAKIIAANSINKKNELRLTNENTFHIPLEKGTFHQISFTVPNLGLKPQEFAVYNIELRKPGSGQVVGGVTMVVTG
jgi:hypothetical protein